VNDRPPIRWASLILGILVTTLALGFLASALVGDYALVIGGHQLPRWVQYAVGGVGAATGLSLLLQVVAEARAARRGG
jgi:hypothetical protein